MRKTWRLQGGSDPLVIVRRSDLKKDEKPILNSSLLAAHLDRWLADPFIRRAVLDMYESMGGPSIRSGQTNPLVLVRYVKARLETAFRRGDLVALGVTPERAAVAAASGALASPAPAQAASPRASKSTDPGDLIVTVINDEDNTKVSGVTVQIQGPQDMSKPSDGSGQAAFRNVATGPYKIGHTSSCFTAVSASGAVRSASSSAIELHVRHVHAVLAIKELAFSGNNVVEKDTQGGFPSPEWSDGRAQADQSPVAYARNKKMSLKAKFSVKTAPCRSESVAVKGTAKFGSASLEWTGTVTVNPGDSDVTVSLTSNSPLANEVGIFESSDIRWIMNPSNQGWSAAGATRNVLYVTLGDPSGAPNYWTLLDISCRGAAGKASEDDFVKASFEPFRATLGDGKGFKRKRDGVELTYYKSGADTPSKGVFDCAALLGRADGTGRCGAWARFLVAMHQAHGVTSSAVLGVGPIDAQLLIVKNCAFSGTGSLPPPFPYKGMSECLKNDGIFGQGKNNPQFTFGDHALVKHSTGIYDPSYGVGPKPDLKSWEDGGIAGIGSGITWMKYGGDSHGIPAICSPGFVFYRHDVGDTLAYIAARYNVASALALYMHPYNAAFRAQHPAPYDFKSLLKPEDKLVIPRDIAQINVLKVL